MPINYNPICVWDLEATGKDKNICFPLEIAATIYNARTLKPYSNGHFHSFMKCPDDHPIEEEALKINHIKREDIATFPEGKVVWNNFVDFVNRFNFKKSAWGAPYSAGKNVKGFDNIIAKRMNEFYCAKGKDTILFSDWRVVDLEDLLWPFFESEPELPNMKMDTLRPFFGLETSGAHGAKKDVEQEGALLIRFMEWFRSAYRKNKDNFKGAFKNNV